MLLFGVLRAQNTDSLRILSLEAVSRRVLQHHPFARQGDLLIRSAEAELRSARGGFDPKLYSDWQQKSFKKTEYYTFSESGLKIPTWYGLEVKGVFQTARGAYVDPEHNLPNVGQAILGIKASALRGLMIDERRATLQQARIMRERSEVERRAVINDLLINSISTYWEWWAAYRKWDVYRRALENARERQIAVVASYEQGDKPAIDTLESFVQVQNRMLEQQQAELEFRNAGLELANYLWEEGEIPLELEENVVPEAPGPESENELLAELPQLLSTLEEQHPDLRAYQLKILDLQVSRRLAAEQLKPRLDLEYNFLGNGFDFAYDRGSETAIPYLLTENYKVGISFETPLFLRKARGKLQQTDVKILDAEYELQQKRLTVNNKVLTYFNAWQTNQEQLDLYNETVTNYRQLLSAELQKFSIGESSIFLINSRENKLIEAELKLIELQAKLPKLEASVRWAAGRLGDGR
jgi:outer membrane protein TolC